MREELRATAAPPEAAAAPPTAPAAAAGSGAAAAPPAAAAAAAAAAAPSTTFAETPIDETNASLRHIDMSVLEPPDSSSCERRCKRNKF